MVEISCTHVCKWRIRPVETIPRMGEEGKRRMREGMNSTMFYCKKFVNVTTCVELLGKLHVT
jgi:hypothetical protein